MNISQIKAEIASKAQSFAPGFTLPNLSMVRQYDQEDASTPWLSHWDNDHRIRVTMHEEIKDKIIADPTFAGLALKPMVTVQPDDASKAPYARFVVITPQDIEATF